MTSMFDQFEQASVRSRNNNLTVAEMVSIIINFVDISKSRY